MTQAACKPSPSGNGLRLGHVFERYGEAFIKAFRPTPRQIEVMSHIRDCRTERMGSHTYRCNHCGWEQKVWDSCRDRHCPTCQTVSKEHWLSDRKSELLPVNYVHMVFTLPHDLNPLLLYNQQFGYDTLFQSVSSTLQQFSRDPRWKLNGKLGYLAVLHTWTQTIDYHVHLHCIIPAGALSFDGKKWHPSPTPGKDFLFRVECLSTVFKNKYLVAVKDAYHGGSLHTVDVRDANTPEKFQDMLNRAWSKPWVVYAKKPFAGPKAVLEYLGRYTHRTAISNNRLLSIDNGQVRFSWRDRRDNNELKEMTLDGSEFVRRFLRHVLPKGFVRLRYFGYLSNSMKKNAVQAIREDLGHEHTVKPDVRESTRDVIKRITGIDITQCPQCSRGHLEMVRITPRPVLRIHPMRGP